MSEPTDQNTTQEQGQATVPAKVTPAEKKVFTRADIKRSVSFQMELPKLYPDFEPFGFNLRLKLSREADDKRQEWLSLAATIRDANSSKQALDEVCDLLIDVPTGFADLKDTGEPAGVQWRRFVETESDPEMKQLLTIVTDGADTLYWQSISPREFRR